MWYCCNSLGFEVELWKNNETRNALKCLKPSGLIDWVKCRLCSGWVHIKCANFSKTEARSLAEFKCCRWSLVNPIPQCHDDNFRPDTQPNSCVVHLKRVPKNSRIPLAENLTCECDSRRKSTIPTSAVLLWCKTNCAENAWWRTWSYRCR